MKENNEAHAWLIAHDEGVRKPGDYHTRTCELLQKCIEEHVAMCREAGMQWAANAVEHERAGDDRAAIKCQSQANAARVLAAKIGAL